MPPNASESVADPWNLLSVICVPSVTPFLIVAKPDIDICGVNSTDEIIATIESETISCVTTLVTPVVSVICLTMAPEVPDPAVACGPTSTHVDPLYT